MKVIESSNMLTKEEGSILGSVDFWDLLPFKYSVNTSKWYTSYASFSHVIIERWVEAGTNPTISSPEVYGAMITIFNRFCKSNNIEYTDIYRMCLNLSIYSEDKYLAPPHVDHDYPHKMCIIYLNTCGGKTVLYDKVYNPEEGTELSMSNIPPILKEYPPIKGTVISTDGLRYHAGTTCGSREYRLICVITYN
jgi:hypothetical protein